MRALGQLPFAIFLNCAAETTPRSLRNNNFKFPSKSTTLIRKIQMDNVSNDNNTRGALIVLEGLDRCGKTSQSIGLLSYLERLGFPVELWRFPDRTTCVGQMISAYLANKSQLDDRTIHLLFTANRWEKRSLMESKLKSGTTLIVDRYSYSGVAFSSAKGLDFEWCKAPEKGLLAPDLVVYLDIAPEKASERGGYGGERYEELEFQKKVALHYDILRDSAWKIVDACLPMDEVAKQLRELVLDCITTCRKGKPLSELWSRADVAEAKMKGEVGAKLRQGQTEQNAAKIDAETKIISTQRQGEGKKEELKMKAGVKIFENQGEADVAEANAELATKKSKWAQQAQMAEVESVKAVAIKEAELQREVELKNADSN